jgi:hypothetical protein
MTKTTAEDNVESRAEFFKALGHPARLLILNLVRLKPRHGEELAAILCLDPATISHHLARLAEVGLLTSRKDQYYQTYSLVGDLLDRKLADLVSLPQPGMAAAVQEDAYRDKVLRTFLRQGHLIGIPAQLKKQQVILERLVQEFEPGRTYSEREVNQILVEFHEDVATLRRSMISFGLLTRDHEVYRRPAVAAAGSRTGSG